MVRIMIRSMVSISDYWLRIGSSLELYYHSVQSKNYLCAFHDLVGPRMPRSPKTQIDRRFRATGRDQTQAHVGRDQT